MSSDLSRENSFRTALKNQKRRLSATKLPAKPVQLPDLNSCPQSNLKSVLLTKSSSFEDSDEFGSCTPKKFNSESLAESEDEELEKSMSAHKTEALLNNWRPKADDLKPEHAITLPSPSPYLPRTPSPLVSAQMRPKSPVPPGSPLLCKRNPPSPVVKRVKEFNKELRRARSFRR